MAQQVYPPLPLGESLSVAPDGSVDAELVLRTLRGDDGAFADLFDRHAARIHALSFHLVSDRVDAEDITQDAFLQALSALPTLRQPEVFGAWVARIATNIALNLLRRRRRLPQAELSQAIAETYPDSARWSSPEIAGIVRDEQLSVHVTLQRLAPSHRAALALREIGGLTYAEMARALGTTLGGVEALLFRARTRFRDEYLKVGDGIAARPPATTCKQARRSLAALVDDELAEPRRTEVVRHVRACEACSSTLVAQRQTRRMITGLPFALPASVKMATLSKVGAVLSSYAAAAAGSVGGGMASGGAMGGLGAGIGATGTAAGTSASVAAAGTATGAAGTATAAMSSAATGSAAAAAGGLTSAGAMAVGGAASSSAAAATGMVAGGAVTGSGAVAATSVATGSGAALAGGATLSGAATAGAVTSSVMAGSSVAGGVAGAGAVAAGAGVIGASAAGTTVAVISGGAAAVSSGAGAAALGATVAASGGVAAASAVGATVSIPTILAGTAGATAASVGAKVAAVAVASAVIAGLVIHVPVPRSAAARQATPAWHRYAHNRPRPPHPVRSIVVAPSSSPSSRVKPAATPGMIIVKPVQVVYPSSPRNPVVGRPFRVVPPVQLLSIGTRAAGVSTASPVVAVALATVTADTATPTPTHLVSPSPDASAGRPSSASGTLAPTTTVTLTAGPAASVTPGAASPVTVSSPANTSTPIGQPPLLSGNSAPPLPLQGAAAPPVIGGNGPLDLLPGTTVTRAIPTATQAAADALSTTPELTATVIAMTPLESGLLPQKSSPTATGLPQPMPTTAASPTITATATLAPLENTPATATSTLTPPPTPTANATDVAVPMSSPTDVATATDTPTTVPTPTNSPTSVPTSTDSPTSVPSTTDSPTGSPTPTNVATVSPTGSATAEPPNFSATGTVTSSAPIIAAALGDGFQNTAIPTAAITNTAVPTAIPPTPTSAGNANCPVGWNCLDVGTSGGTGGQLVSSGVFSVTSDGGDVGASSDSFHYVWQSLAGDGTVSAQVLSQQYVDTSAKAGVMIRQDTTPGSPYYYAAIVPGLGVVVQHRDTPDGTTTTTVGSSAALLPLYLSVKRSGDIFTAYTSSDAANWNPIAASQATVIMSNPVLAGLAVAPHGNSTTSTATFGEVGVYPAVSAAAPRSP